MVSVWFLVAGWITVSMASSIIGALFFGDGPVQRPTEDASPSEEPAPPPSPVTAPGS